MMKQSCLLSCNILNRWIINLKKNIIFLFLFLLAGCVFEVGKKQGLVFNKEDIKGFSIGMTQEKVEFMVGSPSFKSGNEDIWYYVYSLKEDSEIVVDKNFEVERLPEYRAALIFKNKILVEVDIQPIHY